MFGLMRAKTCGLSDEQKLRRRLHYCGTCKTIGAVYGQKARLLLNHDTVFLAEILTALGGDKFDSWQRAFHSYNCLTLPQDEMPLALEFAATANIVLTEFKIKDHIADEQKSSWRIADKTFFKAFQKAARKLESLEFPIEKLRQNLAEQTSRENNLNGKTEDEILEFLAQPTANATALFFAEGAKIAGCETNQQTMFALGFAFGKLVYLLDAFEDYEKDFRKNQFNAFRAAFAVQENKLSSTERRKAIEKLKSGENEIIENLDKLPIESELKQLFRRRLESNLQSKLKNDLPVLSTKKVCVPKKSLTISQRWKNSKQLARELTTNSFQSFSWKQSWQYLPAFAIVALVAFIAPQEAAKAKSPQDCAGMFFNLMFIGSLIGAVLSIPIKMAANLPPNVIGEAAEKIEKKRRQGWCAGCSCGDCCDCGECCGEGCCDCGCDGCCCGDCGDCCNCDC